MRVWLDPNKVAARGLTASDVVTAMQEQNAGVSAGSLAPSRCRRRATFLISINAQGRLHTEEEFGNIILKTAQDGSLVRSARRARIEMGSGLRAAPSLTIRMRSGSVSSSHPALTPSICRTRYAPKWPSWPPASRKICNGRRRTTDGFRPRLHPRGGADAAGGGSAGGAGGDPVPADPARVDYPADRGAGIGGGYLQHSSSAGLR